MASVSRVYTEGMTLLRADMRVLTALLAQMCPRTARIFGDERVELTSICSEWYITWFAKSLPIPAALRVWDTLFFEGFKVLFRVSVGVFKRVEAEVLSVPTFEHIMEHSKRWPRAQFQHNELLKASFGGMRRPLRRRDLQEARAAALDELAVEDADLKRRQEAYTASRAPAPDVVPAAPAPASPVPVAPAPATPTQALPAVASAPLDGRPPQPPPLCVASVSRCGGLPVPMPQVEEDSPLPPPSPPAHAQLLPCAQRRRVLEVVSL